MKWKRSKRTFVRKVKKYLRKYSKKKKGSRRVVQNKTWKVKGVKLPSKRGAEMKWTIVTFSGGFTFNNDPIVLWRSDGAWAGTRCITNPTQGIDNAQYIGTQVYSLYADVRFYVTVDPTVTFNFCPIRIACVQTRNGTQEVLPFPTGPNSYTTPLDAKTSNIFFDKVLFSAGRASIVMTPKFFRFKIPLKGITNFSGGNLTFPQSTYIVMWSTGVAYVPAITCKFYYKDP